jgi:hypothetical protein
MLSLDFPFTWLISDSQARRSENGTASCALSTVSRSTTLASGPGAGVEAAGVSEASIASYLKVQERYEEGMLRYC